MAPVGSVLRLRKESVDRTKYAFSELQPITIHFDGSIDRRVVDGNREYSMDLFFARPGDIVAAKIDLKNGAVGIVPDWTNVVVTGHFAVYEPDRAKIVPEYFERIIQAPFFKAYLWRNKVGAEGRKEVKLDFFEAVNIPIPSLHTQRAILAEWQKARQAIAAAELRAVKIEAEIEIALYEDLGTAVPQPGTECVKFMPLRWSELDRWSFNYLWRVRSGLLGFQKSRFPIVPMAQCIVDTRNGFCIKPVAGPTPHKMLKLNALNPRGLDVTATKYIRVSEKTASQFHIRSGDLLMCRSVGSYDHIAKCAVVKEDDPSVLYPDIMIRVRFNATVLPDYVREVVQSSVGRSHFLSNARTAVGMWKIGAEDIRTFPLPLPTLDIQRRIMEKVADGRSRIAREREIARVVALQSEADMEAYLLGTKKVETT